MTERRLSAAEGEADRGVEKLTLVVMAAGMGRRYGGLKQVEPVGAHGELIVDYCVFDALRAGFDRVLFVVRPEVEEALRARFDVTIRDRCAVGYVPQRLDDLPRGFEVPEDRVKPWGTGQAVLACREALSGPFAVINADDFYGQSGYQLLAEHLRTKREHALVGFPLDATMTEHGTVSRGICRIREDGTLDGIAERKRVALRDGSIAYTEDGETWHPIPDGAIASMNFWGFAPTIVPEFMRRFERFLGSNPTPSDEFFIPAVVGEMVDQDGLQVRVLPSKDAWFGVTYREDLAQTRAGIEKLTAEGRYPSPLWG